MWPTLWLALKLAVSNGMFFFSRFCLQTFPDLLSAVRNVVDIQFQLARHFR